MASPANQSTGILAAMSQDSGAPEDRAQNLGEDQQAATAIMIDRAVSNLETIFRVDNDLSHNELERRMSTPGLNTRVLPLSSPYVAANGEHGPTTSERRHSSASSLVYPRSKYWNVDDSRREKLVQPDAPSLDPSRGSFVRVSPTPVVADNLGPKYCHPCRGSSPHVAGFVNHRPASPSGVDSARPSLSVFRFKQMPPHATNVASAVPLRTLSPRRRGSAGEVSASLLKPTFNSARRSTITITAHALAERNGSSSPTQDRLPDRRASVSDAAPSGAKQARRKTSAGDGPGPSARRKESEPRSPRMELSGPLGAVVISWTNMTVTSREGKILLDNLSGQVHTGFTAIIGPSGSGKSTLLNTLACRMDKSANVHGKIRLNGKGYTNADLKRMSGYVMQDDLLNPHLTVDETLWYTVKLKLAPAFTEQELEEKVNTVVKQMGLEHCRGTVIGSALRKGISGGERKRVAVGMELLTGPQLLFLDEPTSGLDSVTALSLCTLLRHIADERYCTVLCTIHQPQSKIFNLFQHLIILKAGKLIYQGSAPGVLKFFEESGFPCPEFTNPADHFLDVISHSNKYHTQSNEEKLRSKFIASPITAETTCQLISPIIFSFVVYWMVGFQQQARKFFLFVFFMILCQLSATSLALMTSALCRTTDLSVTVLPMLLEINRLFGGFFLPPISLPKYFYWLDALSYVKYCYIAISQNELHDLKIVCLPGELKNGVCPVTSGLQIIHSLGLDYITIADCAGILIVYIIVTRLVAYLGIRFLKD